MASLKSSRTWISGSIYNREPLIQVWDDFKLAIYNREPLIQVRDNFKLAIYNREPLIQVRDDFKHGQFKIIPNLN
jgi:hypothetical protein